MPDLSFLAAADADFTRAPRWDWLGIGYFFLGGLAAGSYMLAAVADLFGGPEHRGIARRGFRVAVPALILGAVLLVLDLTRPERFWHMLVLSKEGLPAFKIWSPMSVGAWALALLGALATASALGTYAEEGRLPRAFGLARRGVLGRVVTAAGGAVAFFVASYTGVLLAVTNRPLWSETPWLGFVFCMSAASTSASLLALLSLRSREAQGEAEGVEWLTRFLWRILPLEVLGIVALAIGLGSHLRLWTNAWGLLLVAFLLVGLALPAWLHRRGVRPMTACVLVLLGGFLLRAVVVLSVETL